jgi:hypothetical protein
MQIMIAHHVLLPVETRICQTIPRFIDSHTLKIKDDPAVHKQSFGSESKKNSS